MKFSIKIIIVKIIQFHKKLQHWFKVSIQRPDNIYKFKIKNKKTCCFTLPYFNICIIYFAGYFWGYLFRFEYFLLSLSNVLELIIIFCFQWVILYVFYSQWLVLNIAWFYYIYPLSRSVYSIYLQSKNFSWHLPSKNAVVFPTVKYYNQ